jgi:bifunctional non-homologous end joining protein LigD
VANFEFATWTKSGRIRKPATFLGFRKDKKPDQVVREVPKSVGKVEDEIHGKDKRTEAEVHGKGKSDGNWRKIVTQKIENQASFDIGDCSIELTNVDRPLWKGIPKARLIEYYHGIAPLILPYLKDRPQNLFIKPVNAGAEGFFIKDMEGHQPECAEIFTDERRHPVKGKKDTIDYLVCNNEATLLWMINLGCIDVHPWASRRWWPDLPDYISIDLDPTIGDEKSRYLDKLLETAMAARAFCDKHKLKAFAKTSGKSGMHFYLPCSGIDYAQAREIAEHICSAIRQLAPGASTTAASVNSRGKLVYIDPSQNDYGDTLAAPYSVRPWHSPTVSTPLEWKEINPRLDPSRFTIDTILTRIQNKGDLFSGVLDEKIAVANTKRLVRLRGE